MMQIDLTVHIADFINRFKSVSLPGIGTFSKVHVSAALSDEVSNLESPRTEIHFDGDVVRDDLLAKFIAEREGIDQEKVDALLEAFSERKLHHLLATGKVSIYPLGNLVLKGDLTTFECIDNRLVNKYFGLQPITVTPVTYDEPSKTASAAANQQVSFDSLITVEDEETSPWWRWLVILALAAILVLTYLKCDPLRSALGVDDATPELEDTSQYVVLPGQEINESQKRVNNKSDIKEASAGQRLHIDDINDGAIDSLLADEELRFAPGTEMVECIIVLGSYTKQRNAIKMMTDVENAGHKVYVGINGDLTRVGLTFNCAKEDLVAYIQKVRKTFVSDAWYLVPELHVEYGR